MNKKYIGFRVSDLRSYFHSASVVFLCLCGVIFSSCGYTTKEVLPSNIGSIAVQPFENHTFEPGLEINLNQKLTERILFEGVARLESPSSAEAILRGVLLEYRRDPLRYSDTEEVEEYRLKLIVDVVLESSPTHEILWRESSFTGESTFFTAGSLAKSETDAREELLEDLARRLVGRLAEAHW